MLIAAGYRVVTPREPERILELLRADRCSALIINNTVPTEPKKRILEEVRKEFPDLPVIQIYRPADGERDQYADA